MKAVWVLAVTGCLAAALPAETYDVILRGGRVVDGTGAPAFSADVGVRAGRIARVGIISGTAARELDVRGLFVAPGFIDVHTHADEIADQPEAENFLRMGVTTIVAGNCGSSPVDVGRALRRIERKGISANFATLIGHNAVREAAMKGEFDRAPTEAELARMKELVQRAMKDGAVGLSTGLIYLPGTFSKTEEIIELARVAAEFGGIYASHMRHEDWRIEQALEELFRIAREAHIRAHISHIKLAGERAWGRADRVLARIEQARAEGLDITQDQYAYTASSTGIRQLIPDDAFDGGREKFLERLADPAQKAKIVEAMRRKLRDRGRDDYAYAVIASFRGDPSLNGLNLVEAARKLRGSDSLDDQIETILEIQKRGGASGVFHGMNEADLQTFLRHPNTMIACDSGLRRFGEGVPHPRGYGNNARVLGRYVRELGVLRLEEAVRKM
ncbi:MAG: amidohydrolase family protein, partial [Verrucomicrobiales bacterium]|nr:amidohydrolase family protein [Verrucomicrobiales bacterium]